MSCQECRILFLEDNVAALSDAVARMLNVMHCSENSNDVGNAQRAGVKALKDVRTTWEKYECNHTKDPLAVSNGHVEIAFQNEEERSKFLAEQTAPEASKRGPGRPKTKPTV